MTKKKVTIIITTILILVFLLILLVLNNINYIIRANHPYIERLVSDSLGNKTTFKNIDANLFPLGIKINNLSLGNNPTDINIEGLIIKLRIFPLLQKKIEISEINIIKPRASIQKTSDGITISGFNHKSPELNLKTSTQKRQKNTKLTSKVITSKTKPVADTNKNSSLPSINLNNFSLTNGSLAFLDQTVKKTYILDDITINSSLALEHNNLILKNATLTTQFENIGLNLQLKKVLYNSILGNLSLSNLAISIPGMELKADISLDNLLKSEVISPSVTGTANLKTLKLDLKKLHNSSLNSLTPLPITKLSGDISSRLSIAISEFPMIEGNIDISNLTSTILNPSRNIDIEQLYAAIGLTEKNNAQYVTINNFEAIVNQEPINLKGSLIAQPNNIVIDNIIANLLSGSITLNGRYTTDSCLLQLLAKDILIDNAAKMLSPSKAIEVTGKIQTSKINAKLALKNDKKFHGEILTHIVNGEIKGINILKRIFDKLDKHTIFKPLLQKQVPQLNTILAKNNTTIKDLKIAANFTAETLKINQLKLTNELFSIQGKGLYKKSNELDMKATLIISKELSSICINSIKELDSLLNRQGQIALPLTIQGQPPHLSFIPEKILSNVIKTKANTEINKLLGKSKKIQKINKYLDFLK